MKTRHAFLVLFLIPSLNVPAVAQAQKKAVPTIVPAEKLSESWDEIDQRLIFLMVRLANVETSLDAVEKAIASDSRKKSAKKGEAKKADRDNEAMDRKGGGPMRWSDFYGTTAEKFFYHPTDQNSTYHTKTVLSQQGSQADSKIEGGVPSSQGAPAHQRPPQFDYIYRANEKAKQRAEADAAELKGKVDELVERRGRLETEQSGLWCEIAFRAISHYDLDRKPLYRFEPLLVSTDPDSLQHADSMKAAASFMALALSIIDEAQKDQATTFSKIKPAVSNARQRLSDGWLKLGVNATDRKTTEGKFAALAKRLDDMASNLSDSYAVANEGDQANDQLRKDMFRALLQESLVGYAQIILALDEMSAVMNDDWKIKPDVKRPIQFVSLASVQALEHESPIAATTGNEAPAHKGQVLLSADASYTASSHLGNNQALPSLLTGSSSLWHGNGRLVDDATGDFAFSTNRERGAHINIELKRPSTLSKIIIKNRTHKPAQHQAKGLTVWVSANKANRGEKIWEANEGLPEWTITLKKPVNGQFITIGLPDDVTNYLQLSRVQIFGR